MILSIYVCVFSVKSSVFMRSIFQTFTVMQIEEDERENEESERKREEEEEHNLEVAKTCPWPFSEDPWFRSH